MHAQTMNIEQAIELKEVDPSAIDPKASRGRGMHGPNLTSNNYTISDEQAAYFGYGQWADKYQGPLVSCTARLPMGLYMRWPGLRVQGPPRAVQSVLASLRKPGSAVGFQVQTTNTLVAYEEGMWFASSPFHFFAKDDLCTSVYASRLAASMSWGNAHAQEELPPWPVVVVPMPIRLLAPVLWPSQAEFCKASLILLLRGVGTHLPPSVVLSLVDMDPGGAKYLPLHASVTRKVDFQVWAPVPSVVPDALRGHQTLLRNKGVMMGIVPPGHRYCAIAVRASDGCPPERILVYNCGRLIADASPCVFSKWDPSVAIVVFKADTPFLRTGHSSDFFTAVYSFDDHPQRTAGLLVAAYFGHVFPKQRQIHVTFVPWCLQAYSGGLCGMQHLSFQDQDRGTNHLKCLYTSHARWIDEDGLLRPCENLNPIRMAWLRAVV